MSKDLAKIHIAKKDLGLDDETYRALLQRVAGVQSARDLDAKGCSTVLAEFYRSGWRPKPPRSKQGATLANDPQSRKIRALWLTLFDAGVVRDASEQALGRYCKRQTGVERLHWLSAGQARKLIEALKQWGARAGVALEP